MAISAAELVALVAVRGADEAALKLAMVGGAVDSAGAALALLATGAIVLAGAGLIGIGVIATRMSADFQQGMTRLKTGAGDLTDNMRVLGQGILQVSVATGLLTNGTDGLNAAMYLIISSGQRGAVALNTLRVAAQGAQIEQAKVVDVTQILTTLQTNWGLKTYTATQYMNGLIYAVAHGKITLEDLSTKMSNILPIAAKFGISFKDIAAAMAVQTNAGLDAARAATGLQAVMVNMENPTKKAEKAMVELGVSSIAVANEMKKSLPGAFQMLINAALKVGPEGSVPFNRAMADMVGGGTRTAKTIDALVSSMVAWKADILGITAAMKLSAADVMGWSDVLGNVNIQFDRGKAALAAFAIVLGNQLLPYVTQFLNWIIPLIGQFTIWIDKTQIATHIMDGLIAAFQNMVKAIQNVIAFGTGVVQFFQQNQVAADALGVALGMLGGVMTLFVASSLADMVLGLLDFGLSLLVAVAESVTGAAVMSGTFTTMAGLIVGAMGTAAASILTILGPFILVGAGIALAVIGIVLAVQHWGEITAWFQGVWSGFTDFLSHTWGVIASVSSILLIFFAPALIIAGTQAVIAGAKITASFVASLIVAGAQAAATGLTIFATFIAAMVDAGIAAIVSGGRIIGSFVASLFAAGLAGWTAAAGIFATLPALIATGAQAVITGVAFAANFVGGVILAGSTAFATSFALTGSLIPALYAMGIAVYAAMGPIGLIAGALVALGGLFVWLKSLSDSWGTGLTYQLDSMGNHVQRSTGRIIQSTQQMNTGVTSSTDQMKNAVDAITAQMDSISTSNVQSLSSGAIALMQKMGVDVTAAMQNMSQNTIRSWNNLAADFSAQASQMVVKGNTAMGQLGYNTRQHFVTMAADSHQTVGQMATDVPAQISTMDTNVQSRMNSLGSNITTTFDKTRTDASSKVAAMSSDVTAKFTTIANNGKTQFANLAANIATGLNTAKSSIFSISGQMVAILSSAWQTASAQAFTGGINTGSNFAAGLRSQIGNVASAAYSLAAAGAPGPGGGVPHFASGTSSAPGGMALVGEQGPELVYIPQGAQVIPNSRMGGASSGGGSAPVIHVHPPAIYLDGRLLASGLLPYISNAIRYATGARM